MSEQEKMQSDLNGYGKRLGIVEVDQGRHDERIKTIESGQAIIFKKLDSIIPRVSLIFGILTGIQITIIVLLNVYWK